MPLRPLSFQRKYVKHPAGSCLVSFGETRVLCTVSIEKEVPPFRRGSGGGWLTAEYSMLPGSTTPRKRRDGPKQDGRSVEIQRLIGRSLRAAVNLDKLGEITIAIDCDVLQADGGTRTASITGAWVALTMRSPCWPPSRARPVHRITCLVRLPPKRSRVPILFSSR